MNSSGIKRGLAASAVAAMAVTGLPFLASSASADTGDVINVASTGPVLNGGTEGGVVVLNTKGVNPANLELANTTLNAGPNGPTQNVSIVGTPTVVNSGAAGDTTPNDGLDQITVRIAVTTPTAGGTANFAVYEDEADTAVVDDNGTPADPTDDTTTMEQNGSVDADEARAQVSMTTSGPVAAIAVTPASQTSAQNVPSNPYTVTLRDSAGRLTQLPANGYISIDGDTVNGNTAVITDGDTENGDDEYVITSTEIATGTDTFTAAGSQVRPYDLKLTYDADLNDANNALVVGSATLDVVSAATITDDEVDIVTGADSWDGFDGDTDTDGNPNNGDDPTLVRVDQGSITLNFKTDDPGSTVVVNASSNNVTFGGEDNASYTTVLNSNGVGSITITPDAGSVQEGDTISLTGSFNESIKFVRAEASAIEPGAGRYVSAIDGTVTVTATVVDQFGLPVTSGLVSAQRTSGPNKDTTAQGPKPVDANGQVSFDFTDVNAVVGQSDTVTFEYYTDQFDNTGALDATTTIRYTANGEGSDFTTRLDNVTASGAGYDPSTVRVSPLTDTVADDNPFQNQPTANESVDLDVVNAEADAPITVSVDNGALILAPNEDSLSEGSASVTDVVSSTGTLDGYRIIGTKSGLVTVTITSANRTETAQFTVAPQTDQNAARNVSATGPESADAGTIATVVAHVTDAFGNPIANVPVNMLNVQVSGPGNLQDTGAVTDANGNINLNVRVQDDAAAPITVRVQGIGAQFGAAADQEYVNSQPGTAKGLSASQNVAEVTVQVNAVEPPVEQTGIRLNLKSHNNGGKKDFLTANAKKIAAGLTVKLFKGNKQIKAKTLDEAGIARFKVKDTNGNKKTKYTVKVAATDTTKAGKATKRVR